MTGIDLIEVQGKALLSAAGIAVPRGSLWPDIPDGVARFVVKAQVPAGGRGKSGGIVFVDAREGLADAATALLARTIAGLPIEQIYIEERLDIARELYLAVAFDRDRRSRTLMASAQGGVDVETSGNLVTVAVDPLLGLRDYHVARVCAALRAPLPLREALSGTIASLYELCVEQDATLVEINPLALTADGRLLAVDAKVSLDERARFRHPTWPKPRAQGTAFEAVCAQYGANAAEIDPRGRLVIGASGAGLMMCSVDEMVSRGATVRAAIDFGTATHAGIDALAAMLDAAAALGPRRIFVNCFFQTAPGDVFGEHLAEAWRRSRREVLLVVRLAGRRADVGRAKLAAAGVTVLEEFELACRAALGGEGA